MPVESDEDRAAFSDPDEFGIEFTYASESCTVPSITGIFDEAADKQLSDAGVIAYPITIFGVRTCNLPADARPGGKTRDIVTLADGRQFAPRTIERDGSGLCQIGLEAIR
jgi:hypothetical protein